MNIFFRILTIIGISYMFLSVPMVCAQDTSVSGTDLLGLDVASIQSYADTTQTPSAQYDVEKTAVLQEIDVIGEGERYTIGSGDILQILVRGQDDFSGRFIVNDDGAIQYNWLGDIKVAGHTKEEVKAKLSEALTKFVRYPEVSVIILEYNSKFVYVLGDVARPGKYAMRGDHLNLRDAVIMAGLPLHTAAMKRARVVRGTENGPQAIKVNLKDILLEGKLEHNYDLVPGDIVVIPRGAYHKITGVANQVLNPLFQALAIYEIGWGQNDEGLFNKK